MCKTLLVAAILSGLTFAADADQIQFTQTGTGSGTLGGTPFSNLSFTISAIGDTSNIFPDPHPGVDALNVDNDSASITLGNLGTFQFTSGTKFFVNHGNLTVGFSRAVAPGNDLYNGPTDSSFATWDMTTSIGPISGIGRLFQWLAAGLDNPAVTTTGGDLIFDDAMDIPVTFTATVTVPEPSTLALLTLGALGLLARRKFARSKK
jgi:hypothetical protein